MGFDAETTNRFGFHAGTQDTIPMHQVVRKKFAEMDAFLKGFLPEGRAKSMARNELEASSMWANKAIAELAPVTEEPS